MFTISNQTDYAMILVEYLADKKKPIAVSQIVKDTALPRRFIARIAADLVRHGFLESKEGINGGYKLVKSPSKINLYDLLKIFEGDLELIKCSKHGYECQFVGICKHSTFWRAKLSKEFAKTIKNLTLKEIITV